MLRFLLWVIATVLGLLAVLVLIGGVYFWQASKGENPDHLEALYVTERDVFMDIAGARVRVRREGAASNPPLILIHGFTLSLESWDSWSDLLQEEYHVIRYDLLGHGLTGPDRQRRYSAPERAEFLEALMDELGIERATLAGNSLGGQIAWLFAASHPDRVERMVLVSAGGFSINNVEDEPVAPPLIARAYFLLAPEPLIEQAARFVYADPSRLTENRLTVVRDMMRREGNGQAFIDQINEFTLPDPTEALSTINTPTLVLWGARDATLPLDHARRFHAALPDAELEIFDDLGHAPQEEAPVETAMAIREFLSSPAD
jgi:pimeloyl-ACP methyl ester carboxylesterase